MSHAVWDVSIASCQSRSHRNTHFQGLPRRCICNALIHPDFENFDVALEEFFQLLGLRISLIDRSESKRLLHYSQDKIYWPHLSVFGSSEGNLEE